MQNHGDRMPNAKPLTEILAADLSEQERMELEERRLLEDPEGWPQPGPEAPPTSPSISFDEQVRSAAIALSAQSFGSQGSFDTEALLRRAEEIVGYIRNGL